MSDPQANQSPDSSGMTFDTKPVATDTPVDSGITFDSSPVKQDTPIGQDGRPVLSPEEQASQTRQMLVSGLTGMPTPNMTADDKASFERGKAVGAVSVPAVAGVTAGLSSLPEAASALYDLAVKHLAGNVRPGMEEEAAKQKLLEMAPKVYKAAKDLGIAGTALTYLWKAVASQK